MAAGAEPISPGRAGYSVGSAAGGHPASAPFAVPLKSRRCSVGLNWVQAEVWFVSSLMSRVKQVAVQTGVQRQDALRRVHERDDVLQKATDVGVVDSDSGRRPAEAAHELLIHEEALGEGTQVRVAEAQQEAVQPLAELAEV